MSCDCNPLKSAFKIIHVLWQQSSEVCFQMCTDHIISSTVSSEWRKSCFILLHLTTLFQHIIKESFDHNVKYPESLDAEWFHQPYFWTRVKAYEILCFGKFQGLPYVSSTLQYILEQRPKALFRTLSEYPSYIGRFARWLPPWGHSKDRNTGEEDKNCLGGGSFHDTMVDVCVFLLLIRLCSVSEHQMLGLGPHLGGQHMQFYVWVALWSLSVALTQ